MNLTLYFIFDVHETLLTGTNEALTEAINQVRKGYGLESKVTVPEVVALRGSPLEAYAEPFFPEVEDKQAVISRIVGVLPELDRKYLRAMDGAEEVLKHIKAEGDIAFALTASLSSAKDMWEQLRTAGLDSYISGLSPLSEGHRLIDKIRKDYFMVLMEKMDLNWSELENIIMTAGEIVIFYDSALGHKAYTMYSKASTIRINGQPVQVIKVGDSPLDVEAVNIANRLIKLRREANRKLYGVGFPARRIVSVLLDPDGEVIGVNPDYRIEHLTEIIEKYPAIKEKAGTVQIM